jgi:hypothetical protein
MTPKSMTVLLQLHIQPLMMRCAGATGFLFAKLAKKNEDNSALFTRQENRPTIPW